MSVSIWRRPWDLFFVFFFFIHFVIVYLIDVGFVLDNPKTNEFPIWPPEQIVRRVREWALEYDPIILWCPKWFSVCIWWLIVYAGPYYLAAMYAFVRGKSWIKIPTVIYCSTLLGFMIQIMVEVKHPTTFKIYSVLLIVPLLLLFRVLYLDFEDNVIPIPSSVPLTIEKVEYVKVPIQHPPYPVRSQKNAESRHSAPGDLVSEVDTLVQKISLPSLDLSTVIDENESIQQSSTAKTQLNETKPQKRKNEKKSK